MKHIIIIGNGIAGITTARWLRKLSDHKITVISSETKFFFSRTALMYIYMGHMRYEDTKPYEDWFWEKNKIELVQSHVNQIDFDDQELTLDNETKIHYDDLVFALGSKPNKFGWKGQDLDGVSGLYSKQDLEYIEERSKKIDRAVIVGGGLIGIELAEMFLSRKKEVTLLVREKSYWDKVLPPEESAMVTRHIRAHHVDLRLEDELDEIIDDGTGKVSGILTKKHQESIPCQYVGLTAGVSPNIAWLKETPVETNRGIIVDEYLRTNINNVYAIGDCAELKNPPSGRRPIEAVWYVGRMMGETLAYNIAGKKVKYNPGIWFNSAKFFDIEYQIYGEMPAVIPEDMDTLYWEHEDGEKSVRINYSSKSGEVVGFNLMGIRYRHEVCEKWIKDKVHIEKVLQKLGMANFDPELYAQYESKVIDLYNKKHNKKIQLKTKRGLNAVLKFLKPSIK